MRFFEKEKIDLSCYILKKMANYHVHLLLGDILYARTILHCILYCRMECDIVCRVNRRSHRSVLDLLIC
jgi:hypothetical protein